MSLLIEKDDLGNWCVKGLPWQYLYVGQMITQEVYEKNIWLSLETHVVRRYRTYSGTGRGIVRLN